MARRDWTFDEVAEPTTLSTSNVHAKDGQAATSVSAGSGGTLTATDDYSYAPSGVGMAVKATATGAATQNLRLPFHTAALTQRFVLWHRKDSTYPSGSGTQVIHLRHSSGVAARIGIKNDGSVEVSNGAVATSQGLTPAGSWVNSADNIIRGEFTAGGAGASAWSIKVYDNTETLRGQASGTTADFGSANLTHLDLGSPGTATFNDTHYFGIVSTQEGSGADLTTFANSPVVNLVSDDYYIVDATTSTQNPTSYSIAQDSGPAYTPILLSTGKWAIKRHTDTNRVYTVTATNAAGSGTHQVTVLPTPVVPNSVEYKYRTGGAWV